MYQRIVKPLLFKLDPEKAHAISMATLNLSQQLGMTSLIKQFAGYNHTIDPVELFGLTFRNRVGLAAGFDKNGDYLPVLSALGFSHIEAGTVTPRPQPGNPKPRLFRLPLDKALINRMGFNNLGVDHMTQVLEKLKKRPAIIGGNIGKNKDTPNEDATQDYLKCMQKLHHLVDYFTVNVSSPNTPGLRALQGKEPLIRILTTLQEYNNSCHKVKPLLLKIAPDLHINQLDEIVEVACITKLDGIIATNTTIDRTGLKTSASTLSKIGDGGLSGFPLRNRSTQVVSYLRQQLPQEIKIIGVGGVSNTESYQQMLSAGADLVQVYSGFIYEGPTILSRLLIK